uniref:Putative metal-dependent phosphoesterase, PHP family n=1 Tax=Desulfovibrio sp. U5L TaxID=596152 RepID=I2Q310_9BACT
MRFDLHVHTRFSACSRLALSAILENARSLGLDGVCLTDHDTMDMARKVREGIQDDGLCVLIGMEYTTPEGDILLYGPFENLAPGLSAPEVLEAAEALGGLAVAAHPFRARQPAWPDLLDHPLLRAVEVENGRNSPVENAAAKAFAGRHGKCCLGGSDAHDLSELGRVTVLVETAVCGRADLVAALLAGRCRLGGSAPGRKRV